MSRAYYLRAGFIRLHRYHLMDFRHVVVVGLHEGRRPIRGWEFQWGSYGLQVAWYWWGFGRDDLA